VLSDDVSPRTVAAHEAIVTIGTIDVDQYVVAPDGSLIRMQF
jgi:hypothetical protein